MIYPCLQNTLPAWRSTYPTYMFKLLTLQNETIELICDRKKSDHVTPYYSKVNILKLQESYKYEVPNLLFGFYQIILIRHSNTYFLRHPKYLLVAQGPQ